MQEKVVHIHCLGLNNNCNDYIPLYLDIRQEPEGFFAMDR